MMLTEDQARTKWCPHVRELMDDAASANRDYKGGLGNIAARCIASECMQWRWRDDEQRRANRDAYGIKSAGFCGLAGKPED